MGREVVGAVDEMFCFLIFSKSQILSLLKIEQMLHLRLEEGLCSLKIIMSYSFISSSIRFEICKLLD